MLDLFAYYFSRKCDHIMNGAAFYKYLLPFFCLVIVCKFIWHYTLEDTWIFLAVAAEPFGSGFLYGATSVFWGLIAWVLGVAFDVYALQAIKLLSCLFAVLAAFVVLRTGRLVNELQPYGLSLFWCVFFVFPFFTWSVTGMDTALSMYWVAIVVFFYVSFITSNKKSYFYSAIVISSFSYGVRPELGWLSIFLIGYSFLLKRIDLRQALLCIFLSVLGAGLTLSVYKFFTGHLLPSSSVKVTSAGFVSVVSSIWLFVQISPFVLLGLVSVKNGCLRSINVFLLSLLGLRFVEQVVIGAIDHRSFSAMFPVLLLVLVINIPALQRFIGKLFFIAGFSLIGILGILNLQNVFWYSDRTENVHFVVQEEIETIESIKTIGTEEVGLLAYRYGTQNIYDYHGLIRNKLDELEGLDALIFTGDLMKDQALESGFALIKKVCFEHHPTIYVRSVGFSPKEYCKSIYLPAS
ncbi:hypothetical protein [Teredinibacter turnerae]|uniref:hypothetical protein n=1 Tax=Teredinibacter turnerae TaxID=2426 RepID=UPI0030CC475C